MISPAARHWSQAQPVVLPRGGVQANSPSVNVLAPDELSNAGRELQLMKVRLLEDVRRLASIRSRSRSDELKRELLAAYWDYCQLALNRPEPLNDPVLSRVCVWCFDVQEFQRGLVVAEAALAYFIVKAGGLRHSFAPEGFKRSLAEVLTESLADTVLKSADPSLYEGHVLKLAELVRLHDMSDPILAKLHRARAVVLMDGDPKTALFHWKEAYALRASSSVAKKINRLEQQLKED